MRSHFSSTALLLSLLGFANAAPAGGDLVQVLAAGSSASFKPAYPYTASVCAVTPVAPPSPVFHCGTFGSLSNPNILLGGMITGGTVLCADVCQADQACVSFGFDSASKVCTLYGRPLTSMGLKANRQSTVTFYNRHCYSCSGQQTGISVTFNPTTTATIASATGFQTASTLISGSVSLTLTLAVPSGTVQGTVVLVVPTPAPTITSATGFQIASTLTSGSVSRTLTLAVPSGTVSGTVVVVVPTPAPTNLLATSGNFTGGLLGGFSQSLDAGTTSSFTRLANGQFAYCCTGVAVLPLAPAVGGGVCVLSTPLNFNILDEYRESFDYAFQNGNRFPVGISNIASPLAGIVVQQVLTDNGNYKSVSQAFSTPNLLNSLTFVLTVPFVGNSACITNIKVENLGPAVVIGG